MAAARQKQGIKENPNADAVVKQQTKAKIEKHRLLAEEDKRARAKAERELKVALEEQKRLSMELEKLAAIADTHGGEDAAIEAAKQAALAAATLVTAAGSTAVASSGGARGRGGGGGGGGGSGTVARRRGAAGGQGMSVDAQQRYLRAEAEELALKKELQGMEGELHSAKVVAGSASKRVADEQQRRERAETALDRFTRISALQRAAQEALQLTIGSPGRNGAEVQESSAADDALQRLAMEIRASGLGKLGDSRSQTPPSLVGMTPRSDTVPSPHDVSSSNAPPSPLVSRVEPSLFNRTADHTLDMTLEQGQAPPEMVGGWAGT